MKPSTEDAARTESQHSPTQHAKAQRVKEEGPDGPANSSASGSDNDNGNGAPPNGRLRLLGFRLVSAYLLTHSVKGVLSFIPGAAQMLRRLNHAVAQLLFGAGIPDGSKPTGSGDRAVDWAAHLVVLVGALLAAALWSVRHRQRRHGYPRVTLVTQLWVRLQLGLVLISYGSVKIFKSQFPQPRPAQLGKALGDLSPMGLLWNFMGHSLSYNIFTGGLEVVAGVLLLFRRTRLVGAALASGVMANVLMLNLSYDVPVKLGSSHLLMMALYLMWQDRDILRSALPRPQRGPWPSLRARKVLTFVLGGLALLNIGVVVWRAQSNFFQRGDGRDVHALYGSYQVNVFEKDGTVIPKEQCGGERWHRIYIHDQYMVVRNALGVASSYEIVALTANELKLLPLTWKEGKKQPSSPVLMSVSHQDDGAIEFAGKMPNGALRLVVRNKEFLLNKSKFRWVTETPYNR